MSIDQLEDLSDVEIKGGTTGTIIGNIGDRLKVDAEGTSSAARIGDLVFLQALNGGSADMTVDGSTTPVVFEVPADSTDKLIITELRFKAFDAGIKIDKFLARNNSLVNGLQISAKSNDDVFSFLPIKETLDFDARFSFGPGGRFSLYIGSGNDGVTATFSPSNPFVIFPQGTFATDDYIRCSVNDNLTQVNYLDLVAFGYKEPV